MHTRRVPGHSSRGAREWEACPRSSRSRAASRQQTSSLVASSRECEIFTLIGSTRDSVEQSEPMRRAQGKNRPLCGEGRLGAHDAYDDHVRGLRASLPLTVWLPVSPDRENLDRCSRRADARTESFTRVQAPTIAGPPGCSRRETSSWAAGPFTPRGTRLITCPGAAASLHARIGQLARLESHQLEYSPVDCSRTRRTTNETSWSHRILQCQSTSRARSNYFAYSRRGVATQCDMPRAAFPKRDGDENA